MSDIKSKPTTTDYRDNWDRIFSPPKPEPFYPDYMEDPLSFIRWVNVWRRADGTVAVGTKLYRTKRDANKGHLGNMTPLQITFEVPDSTWEDK